MAHPRKWASIVCGAVIASAVPVSAASYTVVGWNNLGMHCMDSDFSVLSLLPPYNTIHAQVIDPNGVRVTDPVAAGITVTYEAISRPHRFDQHDLAREDELLGVRPAAFRRSPAVDVGLTGVRMPGAANTPQPMTWDPVDWLVCRRGNPAHAVRRRAAPRTRTR